MNSLSSAGEVSQGSCKILQHGAVLSLTFGDFCTTEELHEHTAGLVEFTRPINKARLQKVISFFRGSEHACYFSFLIVSSGRLIVIRMESIR